MSEGNPFAQLPNMGGDVWARLVPGSLRPWIITGADLVGVAATASRTVPVGQAGVITRIHALVGYSATAANTKVYMSDWTKCTLEVLVAGLSWTVTGTNLVPGTPSWISNPVVTLTQSQVPLELPLSAPIVLSQNQTISLASGGVWPTECAILQLWASGYLGTPGPGK